MLRSSVSCCQVEAPPPFPSLPFLTSPSVNKLFSLILSAAANTGALIRSSLSKQTPSASSAPVTVTSSHGAALRDLGGGEAPGEVMQGESSKSAWGGGGGGGGKEGG